MKWAPIIFASLGLVFGLALLVKSASDTVASMVVDAARAARLERDAHWMAEIATSNAEVEQIRRENLERVVAIDIAARDQIAEANRKLAELEKDNAALPDTGACGLSRNRVQLLNRH